MDHYKLNLLPGFFRC